MITRYFLKNLTKPRTRMIALLVNHLQQKNRQAGMTKTHLIIIITALAILTVTWQTGLITTEMAIGIAFFLILAIALISNLIGAIVSIILGFAAVTLAGNAIGKAAERYVNKHHYH